MRTKLLYSVILGVVLVSCKKPITEPNSGIYRGVYNEILDNGDTLASGIAFIALSEESGSFSLSGDTSTLVPLTCYGDYVIDNETQMTFTNEAVVDVGYHPHRVLDTTYEYTFDDHFFEFSFKLDTTLYEYRLIRD